MVGRPFELFDLGPWRFIYGGLVIGGALFKGEDGVHVRVWAVPGASSTSVVGLQGDRVKIRITSPPEDGKANRQLIDLLESATGSEVSMLSGMTSRQKVFVVTGNEVEEVGRKLGLSV